MGIVTDVVVGAGADAVAVSGISTADVPPQAETTRTATATMKISSSFVGSRLVMSHSVARFLFGRTRSGRLRHADV